ncbi:MAG TPA: VWA domain-containing protein [Pyrinomonadaceae bacterium]|nr:VWA domain-containing protein [Pyrinomonadaceae bacterium]
MRRFSKLACVLLVVLAASSFSANGQQERGSVDWIFVLDTSASMHGAGGTADIFEKVKEAITEFVRNAREGDTVTLYTFDRDTTLRAHIRVSGEIDKRDLLKTVTTLTSEGDRTYTGKAIHDALERAIELKERSEAAKRTIAIVLFTDCLEDVRGIIDPISIPSNINLLPKAQPYVFFVSLGVVHEKQLESFVNEASAMGNRGEVIRDPGASGIAEVGERIRTIVERPPSPPSPTPEHVAAPVKVIPKPLWRRVLNYLLLLIALIAIALIAISALKGEPPWIWLPALTERATLQGELQLIHPRPARVEDEFISLAQLRTKKVSLRSLIPNGTAVDSDAELEAITQHGKLGVKLHRIKGNVYVNKIEVAQKEIYNDDLIELDGSRLLFNWVNHDRPLDSEAGEF